MGEHAQDMIDAEQWAREQGFSQKKIRHLQDAGDLMALYWRWYAEHGEHGENCMCERCVR